MERTPKSWTKNYRPLKIYRNDIERIWAMLAREFSSNLDVRIGQLRLESPEELTSVAESDAVSLLIEVNSSQLVLRLSSDTAQLSVGNEEDTKAMGLAGRIDQILEERQRFWGFTHFGPVQTVFWVMGALFLALAPAWIWFSSNPGVAFGVVTTLLIVYMIVAIVHGWTKFNMVIIRMMPSSEEIGFLYRNKDKLLLVLITGVTSSILGVAATLLAQWLIKKLP